MDYQQLNAELRDFCNRLVDDGHSKTKLCSLLLGQSKVPMFSEFLQNPDRNFGLSVLSQMLDGLGYSIELVPLSRDTEEPKLNSLTRVFLENYQLRIMEGLDNSVVRKKTEKEGTVQKSLVDISNQLFESL